MPIKPKTHSLPRAAHVHAPPSTDIDRIRSSNRWQRLRRLYMAAHPLCERCLSLGITTAAEQVHHKVPLRIDPSLAFTESNLMSVCRPCHEIVELTCRV